MAQTTYATMFILAVLTSFWNLTEERKKDNSPLLDLLGFAAGKKVAEAIFKFFSLVTSVEDPEVNGPCLSSPSGRIVIFWLSNVPRNLVTLVIEASWDNPEVNWPPKPYGGHFICYFCIEKWRFREGQSECNARRWLFRYWLHIEHSPIRDIGLDWLKIKSPASQAAIIPDCEKKFYPWRSNAKRGKFFAWPVPLSCSAGALELER